MSEQDEQWFDALAGHSRSANADDQRLQQALRQAASIDAAARRDQLAERRLLDRLEREGLLSARSEPQPEKRIIWPRLAQVAVIVLCLGLVVELSLTPTVEQDENPSPLRLKEMSEDAAPVSAVAFEAQVESASASPSKARQAPMQAQRSSAKPSSAESSAAEFADQAAPAYSQQGNSALRLAKPPLAKREQEQSPELWVEDISQAREQLQAWIEKAHTEMSQESDSADDGLIQLRCLQTEACKELSDALQALSVRPLSVEPRAGEALQMQLRQKP